MQISEQIKQRLDIVDVVSSYVRLTKSGSYWKACCPFHREKSPSFMVSQERQNFKCFGCGKGGDIFTFVMEIEGVDFKEAVRLLAERAGIDLVVPNTVFSGFSVNDSNAGKAAVLREIVEWSVRFCEKQLWEGSGKKKALSYLFSRGLREETLRTFRIGYAPDGWRHIMDFLLSRGFTEADIISSGMVVKNENGKVYDRFRDRIMFPICDVVGRPIGFSARVLPGGDESHAKYINTPESPIYNKSSIFYGLHLAKQGVKYGKTLIVVEGNMDVLALHQAGLTGAVAVSGTALTEKHVALLRRYSSSVTLFFDQDSAGQRAVEGSILSCISGGLTVSVVGTIPGKDAAEAAQTNLPSLLAAIESRQEAVLFLVEKYTKILPIETPAGKRDFVMALLPILAALPNAVERDQWIGIVAARAHTTTEALLRELETYVLKKHSDVLEKHDTLSTSRLESKKKHEPIIGPLSALWGVLFIAPSLWGQLQQMIHANQEFFDEPQEQQFVSLVQTYCTPDDLRCNLSPEVYNSIAACANIFEINTPSTEELLSIVTDTITRQKELHYRRKLRNITTLLAKAEERDDSAEVARLQGEIFTITKILHNTENEKK